MSRNNDVFNVLVTKGNKAVIAAGSDVTALTPGQIGVFDYNTNLSIDGTSTPRNFYMAVGLDLDGDGVTDDVATSAGSHIQSRNMQFYSFRPHTAGRPLKVVLKDFVAECDTEYGVKLELRNQLIYSTQGYNQFTKTYMTKTACCNGCIPTCPSGDANEITKKLKININNDPTGLITAIAIARQDLTAATHGVAADIAIGEEVSDADLDAIMVFNSEQPDTTTFVYTDLEITTVGQKLRVFSNINLNYSYPRETVAIMTKVGDFACSGAVEVTQEVAFEEGAGYDIKQLEYEAKGFTEDPYRLSTLNGVARDTVYNTVETEKYDIIALTYDQHSIGGWLDYMNKEATCIAVPAVDVKTRNSLITVLDAQLTAIGFNELSSAATAANVDPTIVEPTTDAPTNGIG